MWTSRSGDVCASQRITAAHSAAREPAAHPPPQLAHSSTPLTPTVTSDATGVSLSPSQSQSQPPPQPASQQRAVELDGHSAQTATDQAVMDTAPHLQQPMQLSNAATTTQRAQPVSDVVGDGPQPEGDMSDQRHAHDAVTMNAASGQPSPAVCEKAGEQLRVPHSPRATPGPRVESRLVPSCSSSSSFEYRSGSDAGGATPRNCTPLLPPLPIACDTAAGAAAAYAAHQTASSDDEPRAAAAGGSGGSAGVRGGVGRSTAQQGMAAVPVDRWSHWELADLEPNGSGVAAWGRDATEDPMARHLAQLQPQAGRSGLAAAAGEGAGLVPIGSTAGAAGQPARDAGGVISQVHDVTISMGSGARGMVEAQLSAGSTEEDDGCGAVVVFDRQGRVASLLRPCGANGGQKQEASDSLLKDDSLINSNLGPPGSMSPVQADHRSHSDMQTGAATTGQPGAVKPSSAPQPPRPQTAPTSADQQSSSSSSSSPAVAIYGPHFSCFHEIFGAWYRPPLPANASTGVSVASLASQLASYPPDPGGVYDKCRGLMTRIAAWMDALATSGTRTTVATSSPARGSGSPAGGPGRPPSGRGDSVSVQARAAAAGGRGQLASNTRYYVVVDDTFHPEVRQVLELALGGGSCSSSGDGGFWAPDPIDQVRVRHEGPAVEHDQRAHTSRLPKSMPAMFLGGGTAALKRVVQEMAAATPNSLQPLLCVGAACCSNTLMLNLNIW
jgi:hypothetical protein